MKRRTYLGLIGGAGLYGAIDKTDNGSIDGSPLGSVASFLSGGEEESSEGGFTGGYADNTFNRGNSDSSSTPDSPTSTPGNPPETPDENTPIRETPDDTQTETPTPYEPTPEDTPVDTQTPDQQTPVDTQTPSGGTEYGELGPACHRLYIQKAGDSQKGNGSGTVIGLDLADKEYRIFASSEFPHNQELTGLYDEIIDDRGRVDLPGGLGFGVRTTRQEIFSYSVDAYDDMSDEEEWDQIFDQSDKSNCQL